MTQTPLFGTLIGLVTYVASHVLRQRAALLTFKQIILIPELVSQTCLLLGNQTLTTTEHSNCTNIPARSYGTFDHNINGVGFLTGANTLDVAKIGIDLALLNVNTSLITDAYRRVHNELVVEQAVKADGIRPDGSFGYVPYLKSRLHVAENKRSQSTCGNTLQWQLWQGLVSVEISWLLKAS